MQTPPPRRAAPPLIRPLRALGYWLAASAIALMLAAGHLLDLPDDVANAEIVAAQLDDAIATARRVARAGD